MISKQKSQLLGQWLEAMQNESDTEGVVGWSWGLSRVSGAEGGVPLAS